MLGLGLLVLASALGPSDAALAAAESPAPPPPPPPPSPPPRGRGGALRRSFLQSAGLGALPQLPTSSEASAAAGALPLTVGLGTGGIFSAAIIGAAIGLGYRLLDSAAFYGNEVAVGEAIKQEVSAGSVRREELLVTSKVWFSEMGLEATRASIDDSLQRLQLDYLDLFLVHWPGRWLSSDAAANAALRLGTWRALEDAQAAGKLRAIGVSNYVGRHLDELLEYAQVLPAVNQLEFHPYMQQGALVAKCRDLGIQVEAYSPFGFGRLGLLQDPAIRSVAAARGSTPAQVVLRWMLQKGIVPVPRSSSPSRQKENLMAASLPRLEERDMAVLDRLDQGLSYEPTGALPFQNGMALTSPYRIA